MYAPAMYLPIQDYCHTVYVDCFRSLLHHVQILFSVNDEHDDYYYFVSVGANNPIKGMHLHIAIGGQGEQCSNGC